MLLRTHKSSTLSIHYNRLVRHLHPVVISRYLQAINNQPLPVPAAAAAFTTTIVALAVVRAYSP